MANVKWAMAFFLTAEENISKVLCDNYWVDLKLQQNGFSPQFVYLNQHKPYVAITITYDFRKSKIKAAVCKTYHTAPVAQTMVSAGIITG